MIVSNFFTMQFVKKYLYKIKKNAILIFVFHSYNDFLYHSIIDPKYRQSNYFTLELSSLQHPQKMTMAGILVVFVLTANFFGQGYAFDVNDKECSPSENILSCAWKGMGNYVVTAPLRQEILQFNKLTKGATLLVPESYRGGLLKIDVQSGDIACSDINTPADVVIYIEKQKCVSMYCINMIHLLSNELIMYMSTGH